VGLGALGASSAPQAQKTPVPTAERMRVHRTRRRNGLRCVRISLHETEIYSPIEKGFLKMERRHHSDAVQDAIDGFIGKVWLKIKNPASAPCDGFKREWSR
jgi:hypothetical protein